MGDDIVHPHRKQWDTCNALVVGSIPTPGAKIEFDLSTSTEGAMCASEDILY
jgi:hypothetical protein